MRKKKKNNHSTEFSSENLKSLSSFLWVVQQWCTIYEIKFYKKKMANTAIIQVFLFSADFPARILVLLLRKPRRSSSFLMKKMRKPRTKQRNNQWTRKWTTRSPKLRKIQENINFWAPIEWWTEHVITVFGSICNCKLLSSH